jgi:hypothetical protein
MCGGRFDAPLTCCRNCSLKPALRGFFSLRGTGGAAAAAAVAMVGNPDRDVGCLVPSVDSVSDVDDGTSFVVNDMSLNIIRGCFSSCSGFDDTTLPSTALLELSSSLSAPVASFALDDMTLKVLFELVFPLINQMM